LDSYVSNNGATDANSDIGNTGAQILLADIKDTRDMLSSIGAKIPVGNSDAGSYFNNQVLGAVDYGVCIRFILIKSDGYSSAHG